MVTTPSQSLAERQHRDDMDGIKMKFELFKHITTLATASLVLLASLLQNHFTAPLWRPLIGLAFLGLIISIASSTLAMSSAAGVVQGSGEQTESERVAGGNRVIGAFGGFVVGLISLVCFSLRNFYS